MCDCVQSCVIISYGGTKSRNSGVAQCNYTKPHLGFLNEGRDCSVMELNRRTAKCVRIFRVFGKRENPFTNQRVCASLGVFGSNGFDFSSEMRVNEEKDEIFELGFENGEGKVRDFIKKREIDDVGSTSSSFKNRYGLSDFDAMQDEDKGVTEVNGGLKGGNLIGNGNWKSEEVKEELLLQPKGKQFITMSSMLAKQVIGIQSALVVGFVSQLWVDTATWAVLEVEVRPNLLSSESGKFLLKDIKQVGDVVLVQDESVMLNEFRTAGLETLVGYNVVTPRQRNLGKVRGYTFDIYSGAVESLELDAFGFSIIPSSLVTTYSLLTKDIVEVVPDTIVVHEAAASRIQRLTKGFLGTKNMEMSRNNINYGDLEEEYVQPVKGRKTRRKSSKRKFYTEMRDIDDDLELPMDFM